MSAITTPHLQADRLLTAFDPKHQLRAVFQLDTPPRGTAENAILCWLLSLPAGTDPARAAARLGDVAPFADARDGEAGRLSALLRDISKWPAHRLPTARRRATV